MSRRAPPPPAEPEESFDEEEDDEPPAFDDDELPPDDEEFDGEPDEFDDGEEDFGEEDEMEDDLPPDDEEGDFEEDEEDPGDEEEEFEDEEDPDDDEGAPPDDDEPEEDEDEGDFEEDENEPEEDEPEEEEEEEDFDEDDEEPPSPPSDEPPVTAKKSKLITPVNTSNKGTKKPPATAVAAPSSSSEPLLGVGELDVLSLGLAIKGPPQLLGGGQPPLRKSVAPPQNSVPPPSKARTNSVMFLDAASAGLDPSRQSQEAIRRSMTTNIRASHHAPPPPPVSDSIHARAMDEGYLRALGKFEGDPFEPVYLKVDPTSNHLLVLTEAGEVADFDLNVQSYVFEDTQDPSCFILDHRKIIVVFKLDSVDTFNGVMKQMPPVVFMVAELSEAEQKLLKEKEARKAKTVLPVKARAMSTKITRTKGTSVEDILEQDFEGQQYGNGATQPGGRADDASLMFHGNHSAVSTIHIVMTPQRRKELVETHILKPKYSVRRVTLLCEWVNSLRLWPSAMVIGSIHKDMCNGMLLAKIVKHLNPAVQFVNLNERALAKKPALQNLEQALGHIWRAKTLNSSRVPSAMVIYNGNTAKIAILLNELFTVYVQRPLYKGAVKILRWYHWMLKQYLRPLPDAIFDEGDLSGVWPHFQSGAALFCCIYHLFGPIVIGEGDEAVRIDPLRVAGEPSSICDFRDNLEYVFQLLRVLGVEVLWTPEDWLTHPDTEFIMLQLSFVYEALKHKQCSLPPAQGGSAGLTSGPNGEPIVAGMIFSDTRPLNSRLLLFRSKAVLLGHDKDSMALLPVDRGAKSGRFIQSGSCPLGMVSHHAQVQQISVPLKEAKVHTERGGWNTSASVLTEQEAYVGNHIVALLREHNKRSEQDASFVTVASTLKPGSPGRGPRSPGKSFTSSNLASTKTVPSAASNEVRTKQIETAVRNLEHEMSLSQSQLNSLEDALANRYLELEGSADHCDLQQYEQALDALEVERRELEEEKLRLQDHFARKLESIKEIYKEAEQRSLRAITAGQDHLAAQSAQNSNTTVNTKRNASTSKRTIGTTNSSGPAQLAQAEKGWIKTSKNSTHNFHLKNMQTASSAALKNTWTPKHLKEKEKVRETEAKKQAQLVLQQTQQRMRSTSSSSALLSHVELPSHIVEASEALYQSDLMSTPSLSGAPQGSLSHLSAEELVERSFKKFQYRLHMASLKFQQSKQQTGRARLQDYLNTSVRTPVVEPISLPEKSFHQYSDQEPEHEPSEEEQHQHHLSLEMQALSAAIREDELHRMVYEDERRRLVLSEQALQHSYNVSQKLFTNATNSGSSSPSSKGRSGQQQRSGGGTSHDQFGNLNVSMTQLLEGDVHKRPSAAEVDVAVKWLSLNRRLTIADRTPKEFVFALVTSSNADNSVGHSLEWYELVASQHGASSQHQLYLMGSVAVEDMKEIRESPHDATLFTLLIRGDNTRALKNSKGRTAIHIQCGSSGECGKYLASLVCLKRSVM